VIGAKMQRMRRVAERVVSELRRLSQLSVKKTKRERDSISILVTDEGREVTVVAHPKRRRIRWTGPGPAK